MKRQLSITVLCILALFASLTPYTDSFTPRVEAFGKGIIKKGARGGDVYELQGRLKFVGFYKGKVDGTFGWGTYRAVKNFQSKFGIPADGVVGSKTKLALWKATKNWNPGMYPGTATGSVLKSGSHGGNVYDLQGRLKFLGYYKGKIDGTYGWSTVASVKRFQSKFGLKADGVAGASTITKLRKATAKYKPGQASGTSSGAARKIVPPSNHGGYSSQDLKLMANAVNGESRGEPYIGQVAVAAVILNRVDNPAFPNTIAGVIFQPGAFTAVADGQIWLTPGESSMKAVQDALNGWDPTGGSIYYFNPVTATSKWIWSRPQVKTIGKHIFAK